MKKPSVGKLSRSLGIGLTAKGVKILERRPTPPGQHGKERRPNKSEYGKQLMEKQKLKAQYHVSEAQLRNYFAKALRSKKSTGGVLLQLLESRLDVTVLRAGFATTIYAARQLVSHGHVMVNGKKVAVPGYQVKPGCIIAPKKAEHPLIKASFSQAIRPGHIRVLDQTKFEVQLEKSPERLEIPVICDEQQIVEFYSR